MPDRTPQERRKEAKEKSERSSLDFLLDILSLSPPRSHTREGIVVKGDNVPDIPGHVFQFLGVILVILVMMMLFLGAALGGLMLLT